MRQEALFFKSLLPQALCLRHLPTPIFLGTGGRGAIYRALAEMGRNELRPYAGRKYAVQVKNGGGQGLRRA